ncbi:hypothetical protein LEP1GSC188_4482 [Leptospira weilii serovar Topaz str. LT2116]|uniref:Uncharacterized protein n=1 Tax=Leptospira weilii serovar Topaz str. LT2116 TaxID=1088540 RepID=M3H262_9LEPT|nr:hypothetical protein LEP1GSC188_4482 [Leptospira weilii serovar Topaz str. LT2116]
MNIFRIERRTQKTPLSQTHIRLFLQFLPSAFSFFIQFENHIIGNTFPNLDFQKTNQFPNNTSQCRIKTIIFENFPKDDFNLLFYNVLK